MIERGELGSAGFSMRKTWSKVLKRILYRCRTIDGQDYCRISREDYLRLTQAMRHCRLFSISL